MPGGRGNPSSMARARMSASSLAATAAAGPSRGDRHAASISRRALSLEGGHVAASVGVQSNDEPPPDRLAHAQRPPGCKVQAEEPEAAPPRRGSDFCCRQIVRCSLLLHRIEQWVGPALRREGRGGGGLRRLRPRRVEHQREEPAARRPEPADADHALDGLADVDWPQFAQAAQRDGNLARRLIFEDLVLEKVGALHREDALEGGPGGDEEPAFGMVADGRLDQ
eukprot:scaffold25055_cov106-Isochrysis_galbana.AAC.8